uniref:Uncharacterized protein n=1 Tax=Chromera velia CCMP2878 TaxID=1169474 RepID=A0A0G4H6V4_9ALVE|eukprot:Cvel_5791.t1-p1 / transcript=Cvel_5791.t1 / gene=Cvel_5791 / organism=Chromera_velia_CCMP2878 / gene_product=hypothetical protein / transcript_product=hypothetical protein / location=Cvel_scaffold275:47392-48691(+) / protein_length=139 / sequence_SO=supercontig / SO=protein_coding / is_pseudo=false
MAYCQKLKEDTSSSRGLKQQQQQQQQQQSLQRKTPSLVPSRLNCLLGFSGLTKIPACMIYILASSTPKDPPAAEDFPLWKLEDVQALKAAVPEWYPTKWQVDEGGAFFEGRDDDEIQELAEFLEKALKSGIEEFHEGPG